MGEEQEYSTFKEFYPYYLAEHKKAGTRVTHFIGTTGFFIFFDDFFKFFMNSS